MGPGPRAYARGYTLPLASRARRGFLSASTLQVSLCASLGRCPTSGYNSFSCSLLMSNLTQLRLAAREIFEEALRAVDAGAAVRRALRLEGSRLSIHDSAIDLRNRPVYSIAIGKAAGKMAAALEEILGDRLTAGIIASNESR